MLTNESRPLSYEVVKSGLVNWMDIRFNYVVSDNIFYIYPFLLDGDFMSELAQGYGDNVVAYMRYRLMERCIGALYDNAYFLHFAGWHFLMKYLPKAVFEPEGT